MRIALPAALPQEYRPFMKHFSPWRRVSTHPRKQFLHVGSDREILLVETGMGRQRVEAALNGAVRSFAPDLLVSFGFAGSLHKRLGVGELYLVEDFAHLGSPSLACLRESQLHMESSTALEHFCTENRIQKVAILTGDRPEPKAPLVEFLQEVPSLLDMESYHVARFAMEAKLPFLCFRSVSDGYRDEIDFDPNALTDAQGQVRSIKVLAAVIHHPKWIRSFLLSWKRSMKAGKSLADGLSSLLTLPLQDLRELGGVEVCAPHERKTKASLPYQGSHGRAK